MADQQDGQNEQPEKTTQDAAVPTAEQKTPEVSEQQTAKEQQDLPEDASERTRREFDKVREQLGEERARREYAEAVAQSYMPKAPVKQDDTPSIYDPDTGLINEQVLTSTQKDALEAKERATRAEQALQQYETKQENREVFREYPELDPEGGKHDKVLHKKTRQIMLDSMVNPDDYGKQLSFMDAAKLAKQELTGSTDKAKEQGAKEAIENLTPKEQASLEATGSSSRAASLDAESEEETLRYRARKGDDYAMAELLRRQNISSEE